MQGPEGPSAWGQGCRMKHLPSPLGATGIPFTPRLTEPERGFSGISLSLWPHGRPQGTAGESDTLPSPHPLLLAHSGEHTMKLFFSPLLPRAVSPSRAALRQAWGLPVPAGPWPQTPPAGQQAQAERTLVRGAIGFSSPAHLPYRPPPGTQLFPGFSSDQRQAIFMKANRKCLSAGLGTWTPPGHTVLLEHSPLGGPSGTN